MPIYEYRCSSCGHQQEFLQKVNDALLTICTKCGKPDLTKMVTAAGFQLKGSGWYATDFKSKGTAPKGDGKTGDANTGDAKTGDAKTGDAKTADAKPADAKVESKSDRGSKSDVGKGTSGSSTAGGSGAPSASS